MRPHSLQEEEKQQLTRKNCTMWHGYREYTAQFKHNTSPMDIAAEADASLASFRQEWQKILQDSNLPRRIERHHHFSERFGPACESQMKRCEEFERVLQSPSRKEKQVAHVRDAQEEPISELWALLQSLEKETMDLAKRSARRDNESAESSTDMQQDALEAAFAAFSRFHAVRRKLVKCLECPLSVEVVGAGAAAETGTTTADESDNHVADSGHTGIKSEIPQSVSPLPQKTLRRSKRRIRKEST